MSDWERPIEALSSEGVKELRRLQAENAKLREDLEFERSENGWAREFLNRMGQKCGTKDCPSLVAYVTKIESENAKLRELVRVMAYCMQYERDCDGCAMNGADGPITELAGCDGLRGYMRELGVEVD